MSSLKDNNIYKKTSFLAGNNSSFIEEFYLDYLSNPKSLPDGWKSFFDGLQDEQDLISKNLKGPSWSPKKIRKIIEEKVITNNTTNVINENVEASEQSTKDSVRAIMLIRAFRIRGHLIANLDPLDIQKKNEHSELKPETYGFNKKDYSRKNIFRWSSWITKFNTRRNFEPIEKNLLFYYWL